MISKLADSLVQQYAETACEEAGGAPPAEDWIDLLKSQIRSALEKEIVKIQQQAAGETPTQDATPDDESDWLATAEVATMQAGSTHVPNHDTDEKTESRRGTHKVRWGAKAGKSAPDAPPTYEILDVLGRGGMGIVYKAWHAPLRRVVAVKMILLGAHASDRQLARFQQEAEAAAHLSHPNIVSVYEVGQHRGLPFITLEFVDGDSMSTMLRESLLSWAAGR